MFKIVTVKSNTRAGGLNLFVCASPRLRNEWIYVIKR
jgi:hypothetical protein